MEMVFHWGVFRGAPPEHVGDKPHTGAGRIDVGASGDVLLENIVLHGAPQRGGVDPTLLRHRDVEGQQRRRGRIDGHGRADLIEREAIKEDPHVLDAVNGDPHAADLTEGHLIVGVVPHLSREIEGDRKAGRSLG